MAGKRILEIEVNVGKKQFREAEDGMKYLATQLPLLMDGSSAKIGVEMKKSLQLVADKMKQLHGNPWSPNGQSDNLFSRSGGGLRAIQKSIAVSGSGSIDMLAGRITTGPMAIHETGGTIRAKRAKYLTIPLPSALDSRGIPLRKRARDWDNTFVARSKRGNLLIFRKTGRNSIAPLYVLKESVTIKPRLKMYTTIINDALPYFERKSFEAISNFIDTEIFA